MFDIYETHPVEVLRKLDMVSPCWERKTFPNSVPLSPDACIFCRDSSTVTVQPFMVYDGPIYLDENVFIGPHSFLRGPLYIGKNSKVGPYCEIKRSVIMNNTRVTHHNIIPDSVLGNDVWLAGGVMITNLRLDEQPVEVSWNGVEKVADRFGLFAGDNSVLGVRVTVFPGTCVSPKTVVYGPCTIKGKVYKNIDFLGNTEG